MPVTVDLPDTLAEFSGPFDRITVDLKSGSRVEVLDSLVTFRMTVRSEDNQKMILVAAVEAKDGKLIVRDMHRIVCLDVTVGQ